MSTTTMERSWCSYELATPEVFLLAQLEVAFDVIWAWLWGEETRSTNNLWRF